MMPISSMDTDGDSSHHGHGLLGKWCKCHCGKIRIVNERCFMAPPLVTLGSALAEIVAVFSITGFMAIDVIGMSAVCFSLLLAFASLLFIRFDRLTLLAFLMLSVSLLSSTTFLVICVQKEVLSYRSLSEVTSNKTGTSSASSSNMAAILPSRHGPKLTDLMKAGTELRWMHNLQAKERCCGYWNFTDWIGEGVVLESSKTNKSLFKYHSEPIHPPTKWMVSCCDRNLTQDHSVCKAESVYDDWHDIVQYLFQHGCGTLMDDEYDKVNRELLKSALAIFFWDLVVGIDLIVYTAWKKLRSKAHSTSVCSNGRNGGIGGGPGEGDDDVFT